MQRYCAALRLQEAYKGAKGMPTKHSCISPFWLVQFSADTILLEPLSPPSNMQKNVAVLIFLVFFATALPSAAQRAYRLPEVTPEQAGLSSEILAFIDAEVERAIQSNQMPGCVVAIGRRGQLAFLKAYGNKQVQPTVIPMDVDTLFDLASLTKPIATATSIMILVEQRRIDLDEKVAHYMPEFAANGKENVTVRQLLLHTAGVAAYASSVNDPNDGVEKAIERLMNIELTAQPGERFLYACTSFMILAELIRQVSGKDVHQFSQEYIFVRLGMNETTFLPNDELKQRAAPTTQRRGRWLQGEVHDPWAYNMGTNAGNAGLFSTARDLALYCDVMLGFGHTRALVRQEQDGFSFDITFMSINRGIWRGILERTTVHKMTAGEPVPSPNPTGIRALGWDKRTGYSSNRGWNMSPQAFGHGGFTGTGIWIDPGHDLFVIFLSNRVHPDGTGNVNPLIGRIGTIAVNSIIREEDPPKSRTARVLEMKTEGKLDTVLTGIDVLRRDDFAILQGKRVGLITNHTGLDAEGNSTPMLLKNAPGVELVCLFAPEHGFAGAFDEEGIQDHIDPETGMLVYSLYGRTRRPTPRMLEGVDTLVFDMKDIGTRFYTYISTMGMAMQAAAESGVAFVVLDRPNPIGGVRVEGGRLDPGSEAFVAFHPIAIRHGMTIGELALMFNDELALNLDLTIVPVEGWERTAYFEETEIPWINPSPNMKTVEGAIIYPGLGMIEFTNLSVGRATEIPFEIVGAPWIDGEKLAASLNAYNLAGVRFEATEFTPGVRQYADELCQGVRILVEDRETFDSVLFGLTLMEVLIKDYREQWERGRLNTLMLHRKALEMLESGHSAAEINALWNEELEIFRERRERYLIYPVRERTEP